MIQRCNMGYEVQDDLVPPERCNSDGHPNSCKDCRNYKEYNRGKRADLIGINIEELEGIIELFNEIPN